MIMKKGGLILFLMVFITVCIQCSRSVGNTTGEDLTVLDSLKIICNKLGNVPEMKDAALILKAEAERQDNDWYKGYAYTYIFYHHQVFFNGENKMDTLRYYADKAKEYFVKADKRNLELWVEADLLRWEMYEDNPTNILDRILKLIKEGENINDHKVIMDGYSILGESYLVSNSPKEAYKAYIQELDYVRTVHDWDSVSIFNRYLGVFSEIAQAAESMEDYNEALNYCDSIRYYIEKNPANYYSTRWSIVADALTMKILSQRNQLDKAYPYYEKLRLYCDTIPEEDRSMSYYGIQPDFAYYYLKKGQTEKALDVINQTIQHYITAVYNESMIVSAKSIKADILAARGNYEEAYKLMSEISHYNDSVNQANATRQVTEMYTLYNVEKLEKKAIEDQAQIRNSRIIALSLGTGCLLLVIIMIITKVNYDKMRKKNEKIFEQYKYLDKYKEEVNKLNISVFNLQKENTLTPSLFEKLTKCMYETQIFTDPELTRESLALKLGTNRQYLAEAINENTGMTFMEYINDLRLDHARRLLSQDKVLPIDTIYAMSGFTTKSTFYRLFKQKYDLTPKELRDIAAKESK